jgi:hypothetical protein
MSPRRCRALILLLGLLLVLPWLVTAAEVEGVLNPGECGENNCKI